MLRSILNIFDTDKTVYSHRHRTIEVIAAEKNIDIDSIKKDINAILASEGRTEAVINLRHRFHVPLNVAWIFVDRLDKNL